MTDLRRRLPPDGADAPGNFSIASSDADQARLFFRDMYYPIAIDVLRNGDNFQLRSDVIRLGPLTVGRLQFATPVALNASGLDGYHVTVPLTGIVHTRHADHEVEASPDRAAVFRPGRTVHTRQLTPGSVQLDIKIDQPALESELEALLGHQINGAIDLAPDLDLATGPGRTWRRLVQFVHDESQDRNGLLYEPLIAEQLRHSIISGLLLSARHRYHDELRNPAPYGPPRALRRVVDAMHDGPERQFRATDLASIAGMSVRSLQEGFRRHLGVSPMAYLQQVRLERAHQALERDDPQQVTVAAIAHRWGFSHLGRFACAYRSRYGVSPSDTLRST
jgi:AraC-like DNA-binding protein